MKVPNKKSTGYSQRSYKRYSESFKLQILDELSRGNFTKNEVRLKYNLGGSTLNGWIKKYNRVELLNREIRIRMPKEIDKEKILKQRISDLEKALADTQMESLMNKAYFEILLDETGIDKEAFEKKQKAKQSKKQ